MQILYEINKRTQWDIILWNLLLLNALPLSPKPHEPRNPISKEFISPLSACHKPSQSSRKVAPSGLPCHSCHYLLIRYSHPSPLPLLMRPFRKGCLSLSGRTWSSYFWNGYYELQQKRYAPYQVMPNQPHHVFSLENIWVSLKFKCIRNICEFYFYCKLPYYLEFNHLRQLRGSLSFGRDYL